MSTLNMLLLYYVASTMNIDDVKKFSILKKWNRDRRSKKYANKLEIKEIWK